MNRLYGNSSCDVCHQPSPLGWLYACAQDNHVEDHFSLTAGFWGDSNASTRPCQSLREELEELNFSPSIIAQAEAGVYTSIQIQTLKEQKTHLHNTIAAVPSRPSFNKLLPDSQPQLTTPHQPFGNVSNTRHIAPPKVINPTPCAFKCCHRCRPYLVDRCWTSFDAVFNDELRPLTAADTMTLPVKSSWISRTLGQTDDRLSRSTCTQLSLSPRSRFDPSLNNSSSEGTTCTTATSDSFPYSDSTSSDEDDCVGPVWEDTVETAHHTNDQGSTFIYAKPKRPVSTPDHSMMRTIRRVSGSISDSSPRSTASGSSISLPTPTTARTSPTRLSIDEEDLVSPKKHCIDAGLDKATPSRLLAQTSNIIDGLNSIKFDATRRSPSTDSMGYLGEDIDVEGGVALTEEAVRTHTPDLIIAQP